MPKSVLIDLNLNRNELQNAVIQNLSTAPSNPIEGLMYYNTNDNIAYIYDGTVWRNTMSTGDYTFIHEQNTASDTWDICHKLGKYPSVTVVDSAGNEVTTDVQYIDKNNCIVTTNGKFKGIAYLN